MHQAWRNIEEMSQEEWLSWRNCGIGGSDAPAIMNVSPWSTPFQKWEEKVLGKKSKDNSSKKFGRETEAASRREFEDLVGLRMVPANVQSLTHEFLRASLDGIDLKGDTIVEIKKANKEDHLVALSGKVPEKYYPQCQHILNVTSKEKMYYFSSPASGLPGKVVEVFRDDLYIQNELLPKEIEFWQNVVSKKAPELTEKDVVCMKQNKKWNELAKRWKETNRQLTELNIIDNVLRTELIALSKNCNAEGTDVMISKSLIQGRIDYLSAFYAFIDEIKSKNPGISVKIPCFDKYRKESFTKWSFRDIN